MEFPRVGHRMGLPQRGEPVLGAAGSRRRVNFRGWRALGDFTLGLDGELLQEIATNKEKASSATKLGTPTNQKNILKSDFSLGKKTGCLVC